jgi:hypothetical protein
MQTFGNYLPAEPSLPPENVFQCGLGLIREEFKELTDAETMTDRKDAIGDLLYVINWMANAHGVELPRSINWHESWTEQIPAASVFNVISESIAHWIVELEARHSFRDRHVVIELLESSARNMSVVHGINIDAVTDEIHRSNMTKMWTDDETLKLPHGLQIKSSLPSGERRHVVTRISDGKVIKSPSYSAARL